MNATDLIRRKRDGRVLDPAQIKEFVRAVTADDWPDYQTSAMLMAMFLRGLDRDETAVLTREMADSGDVLSWDDVRGPKLDKHSTGGVGDKTTLVVVPLAAACGLVVPKLSGRGLGHTGGTVDKLEAIPGFRTSLSADELKANLRSVGAAIAGQTGVLAPADKKLYALRDVTATVEHIPLIAASILSKKLASNPDALVLDVKCGRGAFMKTEADARALAAELCAIGKLNGLPTVALITAMNAPLGRAVGNALEVREAVETLNGRGPARFRELCLALVAEMTTLAGLDVDVAAKLDSGEGLEKFRQLVEIQGGELSRLPAAPGKELLTAERDGFVTAIDAEKVGVAAMRLGAGRGRKEDAIDHAVGVVVCAGVGDRVKAGDELFEVHHRDRHGLDEAAALLREACEIGDEEPTSPGPVVLGREA